MEHFFGIYMAMDMRLQGSRDHFLILESKQK